MKPIVVSFESSLHNKSKGEVFTLTCTARGYRQPHMMKLEKKNDASFDLVKEWDINTCTKTGDQTVKCTYTFASLGQYFNYLGAETYILAFSPLFQAFPTQSHILSNITKERWNNYKNCPVGIPQQRI